MASFASIASIAPFQAGGLSAKVEIAGFFGTAYLQLCN
jgi:hypothetical protein